MIKPPAHTGRINSHISLGSLVYLMYGISSGKLGVREEGGGRESATCDKCYTAAAVFNKTLFKAPGACMRVTVLTFVKPDTLNIYIFKLQNVNNL